MDTSVDKLLYRKRYWKCNAVAEKKKKFYDIRKEANICYFSELERVDLVWSTLISNISRKAYMYNINMKWEIWYFSQ